LWRWLASSLLPAKTFQNEFPYSNTNCTSGKAYQTLFAPSDFRTVCPILVGTGFMKKSLISQGVAKADVIFSRNAANSYF
jgi:hypothetical protein